MNKVKMYRLLKEAYDELEFLVSPVVKVDIRSQRGKILDAMKALEEQNDN